MQRRRRPPTRVIKRNNAFDPNIAFQKRNETSSGKKIFKIVFWLVLIGVLSYYSYFNWYLPANSDETEPSDSSSIAESITDESNNTEEPAFTQPVKKIQIEILNGCGKSGIAKIFESYLRQQGFDVVNTENYRIMGKINWNVPNSKVIDQIDNIEFAEDVAKSLGINEKYVSSNENLSPVCDVTVVIGKDFNKLKGFTEFSK